MRLKGQAEPHASLDMCDAAEITQPHGAGSNGLHAQTFAKEELVGRYPVQ
jgi:hypothetical protein